MKLSFRQIEPFVKNPDPAARVILIYGPDTGLMRERAKLIAATVVADLSDPFNVTVLNQETLSEDPARLADEAHAMSMMGGDRVIRVEDAGDKLTPLVKDYLDNPNPHALVILQAGELSPRSSLRKLCEKASNAAALPCYIDDERSLSGLIRQTLQAAGHQAEPDAVTWLAQNIAGDREKVRSELDKIMLYKNADNTPITLSDVRACCGEAGAQTIDDLVYAVTGGDGPKTFQAFAKLNEEGVNFIVMVRALLNHFRRLHFVQAKITAGESTEQAMKALRPPVFFKQENAFKTQINRWNINRLDKAITKLMDLEYQCKQTGAPVDTLCGQAILSISMGLRAKR